MKKKIIIGGICLATCISLMGCGNSQEAVITNLSNQIDLLNNTVQSLSYSTNQLPSITSLNNEQFQNNNQYYQSAKEISQKQEKSKTAVLLKTGIIKNALINNKNIITSKNSKALTDLTSTLGENTKKLNQTKSEYSNAIKEVSNVFDSNRSSVSQISAKINKLSNCLDSQNCYYQNILGTLSNIEEILGLQDYNFNQEKTTISKTSSETKDSSLNDDLQKLLYQYLLNNLTNNNCPNGNCSPYNQNCPNGNCLPYNQNCPNGNCLPYNQNCPECNDGNNCINGNCNNLIYPNTLTENNYGASPYNQIRNTHPMNNRFNPYRNTDTYRTWNRNIDSYKLTGNSLNNINNKYNNPILNKTTQPVTTSEEVIKQNNEEIKQHQTTEPLPTTISSKDNSKKPVKSIALDNNNDLTFIIELDINKNIKDLINNGTEKVFNEKINYLKI